MQEIISIEGPVAPDALGFTLMHEHILVMNWAMRQSFPDWLDRPGFVDNAVRELRLAREAGVRTLVDLTPVNLGRDIHLIQEVAAGAGMQVIAATGLYWTEEPSIAGWSVSDLVGVFRPEITDGIGGTYCRAGIIKCATDRHGFSPYNRKLLQVAAILQKETGVPISTHTIAAEKHGLQQQDIFAAEGVDLSRVIIGHCGDSDDEEYLEEILHRGSYIGMDRFGLDFLRPGKERISMVARLCHKGWAHRMVLSHDAACRMDWRPEDPKKFLPNWNYRYIPEKVVPALLGEGVTREQIHQMTVLNPVACFTG